MSKEQPLNTAFDTARTSVHRCANYKMRSLLYFILAYLQSGLVEGSRFREYARKALDEVKKSCSQAGEAHTALTTRVSGLEMGNREHTRMGMAEAKKLRALEETVATLQQQVRDLREGVGPSRDTVARDAANEATRRVNLLHGRLRGFKQGGVDVGADFPPKLSMEKRSLEKLAQELFLNEYDRVMRRGPFRAAFPVIRSDSA